MKLKCQHHHQTCNIICTKCLDTFCTYCKVEPSACTHKLTTIEQLFRQKKTFLRKNIQIGPEKRLKLLRKKASYMVHHKLHTRLLEL